MTAPSPIDLIRRATEADKRFAHGVTLFDRSEGQLDRIRKQSAINYVDAEYHRRIVDEGLRRRLEQSLG